MSPLLFAQPRKYRRMLRRLVWSYSRCACGALMAYDPGQKPRPTAWDCSHIVLGIALPKGHPGSMTHSDTMPFAFWKVKEAPRDWALTVYADAEPGWRRLGVAADLSGKRR